MSNTTQQALTGKVALVTGASRGIGKAVAVGLAQAGADVAVAARTVERKDWIPGTIGETLAEIESTGQKGLAVQADLVQREDVQRLLDETFSAFGHVDILVNNAAFFGKAAYHTAWEMTAKNWDLQIALNLTAPFLLMSGAAPLMREQGGGRIINVSSGSGNMEEPRTPGVAYGTSKAALNRLTLSFATDLREANISVVSLDPGFTRTEITEIGAAAAGMDATNAHPVEVPEKAILHLATCPNPMWFSGRIIVAADFVQEHNLC